MAKPEPVFVGQGRRGFGQGSATATGKGTSGGGSSSSGGGSNTSGGTGAARGGSGGSGGSGGDFYKRQAKKQDESRKQQNRAAYKDLRNQIKMADWQADALDIALGKNGYKAVLRQQLQNIRKESRQDDRLLMRNFREHRRNINLAVRDNEKAAADQSFANILNRSRERTNALDQAALQGAGESDTLRSLNMSLRNWSSNQSQINRSFFDSNRSLKGAAADLNTETRTGRAAIARDANRARERAWSDFYGNRHTAFTERGNIFGQQAQLFGKATQISGDEDSGVKKHKKKLKRDEAGQKDAMKQAKKNYQLAAAETGKAWKNPGVPKTIMQWDGLQLGEGRQNTTVAKFGFSEERPMKAPEGATLRRWV